MKSKYLIIIAISLMTISCKKLLDRSPQDQITNGDYWAIPNDAKLFANQFYTSFPVHTGYSGGTFWLDNVSDNMLPANFNNRLAGQNNLGSNNTNWNYSGIRSVNFGLQNIGRVVGAKALIDTYKGELLFFRAYHYFDLVKSYGDVPWVSETLNIDSKELYAPRTSRTTVIDSMLVDLDAAITFLPLKGAAEPNRLNKESALLFKSRVALYEGTWQKHHSGTVFGSANANVNGYLEAAAQAAKQLIDLNTATLYSNGNPKNYFGDLFGANDLSTNREVLLWKKYDLQLGVGNRVTAYTTSNAGGGTGLTKSLVDDHLCTDGTPISSSSLYKGDDNLIDITTNRDPRLVQSIYVPGDAVSPLGNNEFIYFIKPDLELGGERKSISGYQLKKGKPQKLEQTGTSETITACIIFRYAEALLNYAEAKAEQGTLTQADLDLSINKLRNRVAMPHLDINAITNDPNWLFPAQSPLINEVRRERRVELALEGFRFDDIQRWAATDDLLVGKRLLGAKFKQSDFPLLVIGRTILVNTDGYIDPYNILLPNGNKFNPGRDYLLPVPQLELTLNDKLVQNPGWK